MSCMWDTTLWRSIAKFWASVALSISWRAWMFEIRCSMRSGSSRRILCCLSAWIAGANFLRALGALAPLDA